MKTKLIQKHLIKGTQEFEIVDDSINIRVKSRFKEEETLNVMLAVLNSEPIITKTHLQFVSRVNGEPLVSLALSKPNVTEFNDFVSTLKQKAQAEYNTYSGINVTSQNSTVTSFDEEPPEFDKRSTEDVIKQKSVNIEGLDNAINMLQTYVDKEEIQPLVTALESLKQNPQDHEKLVDVATVFNELGSNQGAVLTYAPYIAIMLSDDPFGSG